MGRMVDGIRRITGLGTAAEAVVKHIHDLVSDNQTGKIPPASVVVIGAIGSGKTIFANMLVRAAKEAGGTLTVEDDSETPAITGSPGMLVTAMAPDMLPAGSLATARVAVLVVGRHASARMFGWLSELDEEGFCVPFEYVGRMIGRLEEPKGGEFVLRYLVFYRDTWPVAVSVSI